MMLLLGRMMGMRIVVVGLALDLEGTVMMRCRDDEERSKEINIKLLSCSRCRYD